MVDQQLSGGHLLPPVFSGGSAVRIRTAHPRRRRVVWGVLGGLALVGAASGTQLAANIGYDDALVEFSDAATIVESRQRDLGQDVDELRQSAETAAGIVAVDTGVLMPGETRTALDKAIAAVESTTAGAETAATASLPRADDKPLWAWELFGQSAHLDEVTGELGDQAEDLDEHRESMVDVAGHLEDTAVAAVKEAAGAAPAFEAAHVNARNPEIVALRYAAESVTTYVTVLDAETVTLYSELEAAAAAVLETEKAEIAEKQGPLHGPRVEIEAFARSIAPGVLLDFDWSPTVPGYDGPSYGGWTTWWYGDPGYSTIALSDYVAEEWPAAWTKALVVHEVGHAISVKCESMYDSSNQDTIEEWATAWAISMGYTDRANGVDAYGQPSQAMIDAASKCR